MTLTTGEVGNWLIAWRATQCIHCLVDLGVDLPRISCVESLLQNAHFFHELVGVVGCHFFCDGVEALLLFEDLTKTFFDVLANSLFFV